MYDKDIMTSIVHRNGEEWSSLRTPANKRLMKADSAEHYLPQHNGIADELVDIVSTESLEGPQLEDLLFRYSSESEFPFHGVNLLWSM